jgi:hypothetical protein
MLEVLGLYPHAGETVPLPTSDTPDGDMRLCIVARRRIRDATDPEAIAYDEWFSQNLISHKPGPQSWQLSNAPLEVRIHHYPDRLDLVHRLALDIDRLEHGKSQHPGRGWEGATVNVIATGFAWSTLDVTHECNTSLAVRHHDGPWMPPIRPPGITPCEPQANEAFSRMLVAFDARPDPHRHA